MYLTYRQIRNATIVECCGRFDEEDQSLFLKAIEDLHEQGCRYVVIDLASLYFLHPNVISLIELSHDLIQSGGGRFVLMARPVSAVYQELESSNIADRVPLCKSVYDALHRQDAATQNTVLAPSI